MSGGPMSIGGRNEAGCGCGGSCGTRTRKWWNTGRTMNGIFDDWQAGDPLATVNVSMTNQDLLKLGGTVFIAMALANLITRK